MSRLRWVLVPAAHPLGGGRSAAAWRRAVGCEASRLRRVRRCCAWLCELTTAIATLRDCDLHGTLPELVAGLDGTSQVEGRRARTVMPSDGAARGLRPRAAPRTWRGHGLVARAAPRSASRRPARAARLLMSSGSGGAKRRSAAAPGPRVTALRRESVLPPGQGRTEYASPPGIIARPSAASKLAVALADRVHGRLEAAASESTAPARRTAPVADLPAVRAGRATIVAARPSTADVALGAQWGASLVGPSAPAVLLAGLVQGTPGTESPEPRSNEPATRGVSTDAAPSSARRADTARDDRLLPRREVAAGAAAGTVPTPPPPLAVAPPSTAPGPPRALSAEVPARGLGAPAEAAARVRLAAAADGPATDDLGPLATKLRRILAEEARRHGIDV